MTAAQRMPSSMAVAGWPGGALFPTAIDQGDVDVWRVDLDRTAPATWPRILSDEDFRRAARYVFARDRTRFLQARCALRILLAAYSGRHPRRLRFQFNAHGKPELPASSNLGFNLSHSGQFAVVAVGRQRCVGIDIERLERGPRQEDWRDLAQHLFSADERETLARLPKPDSARPFLTCWTRKEAVLKALGVGLTLDPRHLSVGLGGGRVRVEAPLVVGADSVEVETIAADDDSVLSVAASGGYRGVCLRDFPRKLRSGLAMEPST